VTGAVLDDLIKLEPLAPKEDLQGGLLNCSAEGFAKAMDISPATRSAPSEAKCSRTGGLR
jgi:enoyl-[acyl-carrier protein] reductase I